MNGKQWFFSTVAGIFVATIVVTGVMSHRKQEAAKQAEPEEYVWRVWDIKNNDGAYWKQWSKYRNGILDREFERGRESLSDSSRSAIPTTAEEYLQAFSHRIPGQIVYIERLGMREFEKVNAHFLKEFPIVSLQDRLSYEDTTGKLTSHSHRHNYDLNEASLLLHDEWNASLYEDESIPSIYFHRPLKHDEKLTRGLRHQALEMLHRDGVRAFANITANFGVVRMAVMSQRDLTAHDPKLVELPEDTSDQREGWYSLDDYSKTQGPGVSFVIADLRDNYPKYMHLAFYHQFAEDRWFAPRFRQAAGFEPHAVTDSVNWRYDLYQPPKEPQWQVQRMELVSLLKHQEPAVYVSTTLPNMKQLIDGKTRSLNAFETTALQKLYAGEFIISEPENQHLRMVGAIRAGETCIECHAVQKGEMLGAFTYVLYKPELSNTSKALNLSMTDE